MVKAYYQDEYVTIIHGDSREILPKIAAVDVMVCDPPYGVSLGVQKDMRAGSHGLAKEQYGEYEDTHENLITIVAPILHLALSKVKRGAVFTGPHITDMPKAEAFGGIYSKAACGRHTWGFKVFLPFLLYGKDPLLNKGARPLVLESSETAEDNGHPCPKPIGWMEWLINRVALPGESIIDPFMGSGTTLRAAKNLRFQAIGIDIEERYCEIAAKRMSQMVLSI